MPPKRSDERLFAGNRFWFRGTAEGGLTGARLTCTIRQYVDGPILASVDSDDGGVVIESDTSFTVLFPSDVTRLLPPGERWYDVQADPNADESYTVLHGLLRVRRRITLTLSNLYAPLAAERPQLALTARDVDLYFGGNHTMPGDGTALILTPNDVVLRRGLAVLADAPAFSISAVDAALSSVSLSPLGEDLLHHWEVPQSTDPRITLNGSNVAQLNDRATAAKHLSQSSPSSQPPFQATGGANSQPCISIAGHTLANATLAIAAGERLGIYGVFSTPATGTCSTWELTAAADGIPQARFAFSGGVWNASMSDESVVVASPAHTASFVKTATEYFPAGRVLRIGSTTVSPAPVSNGACAAITIASLGNLASPVSGLGKFCSLVVVKDIHVNTAFKQAIVDAYFLARYGL